MTDIETQLLFVDLPDGFTSRPVVLADADVVTEILDACTITLFGTQRFGLQEGRSPNRDLAASSQLVFAADGMPVAYLKIWDAAILPEYRDCIEIMHPDWEWLEVDFPLNSWGLHTGQRAL